MQAGIPLSTHLMGLRLSAGTASRWHAGALCGSGFVQQSQRGLNARPHGVLRVAAHGNDAVASPQKERGATPAQTAPAGFSDRSDNLIQVAVHSGI